MSRKELKERLKVVEKEVEDIKRKLDTSIPIQVIYECAKIQSANIKPKYLILTKESVKEFPLNYDSRLLIAGHCLQLYMFNGLKVIIDDTITEDFIIGV